MKAFQKISTVGIRSTPCFTRNHLASSSRSSHSHRHQLDEVKEKLSAMGGKGHVALDLDYAPGIARILLSNPSKKNALDMKMMIELANHVDSLYEMTHQLENDLTADNAAFHKDAKSPKKIADKSPISIVILSGDANTFCTGFDLSVAKTKLTTPEGGKLMNLLMTDTLDRLAKVPLIVISAIDGYAIGGGAEMSTVGDFRVMNDKASIRFVQTRMGIVPGWGGGSRLIDIVGKRKALQLLASTQTLHAHQALEYGLVDSISHKPAVEAAVEWSQRFLHDSAGHAHPAQALRAMKRLVTSNSLTTEGHEFQRLWGSRVNVDRVNGIFE